MNIIFHHNGHLEGTISLELLEEDYMPQVDQAIKKYSTKVDLKGFRKGQVPYGVVKKIYGPEILVHTVMDLVTKILQDYISNQKLDLWGNPLMTESSLHNSAIAINNPGTLQFKFECGLIPSVDFKKLEEIEVEKYEIKQVSESTVDEAIKKEQLRHGAFEEVSQSESGDIIQGPLTNTTDYKELVDFPADTKVNGHNIFLGLQSSDKLTLHLGPEQVYELTHDDLDFGETRKVLNSLTGEYQFTVEKIYRYVPAELNEEFFSKVMQEDKIFTLEEFKKQFNEDFITYTQMSADMLLPSAIREAVIRDLPFSLPENFIKKLLESNHPEWEENIREKIYEYTQPSLRWSVIIDQFARENKLEVTLAEIKSIVERRSRKSGTTYEWDKLTEEELNKKLDRSFLKAEVDKSYKEAYEEILENKTLEALKNKVSIRTKEKTVEEFDQILKGPQHKNDISPSKTIENK